MDAIAVARSLGRWRWRSCGEHEPVRSAVVSEQDAGAWLGWVLKCEGLYVAKPADAGFELFFLDPRFQMTEQSFGRWLVSGGEEVVYIIVFLQRGDSH